MAFKSVKSKLYGTEITVMVPYRRKARPIKKKFIAPLRKRCRCGRRVKGHHFLCQTCWDISQSRKADIIKWKEVNHE